MFKQLIQNEKMLFAAVGTNGFLEGLRHVLTRYQPELTALLSLLQITVAVLTIAHIARKWFLTRKPKHEKKSPPTPPGFDPSV
jgi:hypothetical protein